MYLGGAVGTYSCEKKGREQGQTQNPECSPTAASGPHVAAKAHFSFGVLLLRGVLFFRSGVLCSFPLFFPSGVFCVFLPFDLFRLRDVRLRDG